MTLAQHVCLAGVALTEYVQLVCGSICGSSFDDNDVRMAAVQIKGAMAHPDVVVLCWR